ncbi:DUF3068 domain-containing protein [Actinomadura napierensis]|uniref:DUF3068 domain-containing protein n=1 Tax=Actinomadura napierensis TaxID=267854 RepID=A0ABP5JPT0_9ACTN
MTAKIYAFVLLGGFLVTAAVLTRQYVYPRVAVIPGDLDTTSVTQSPAGRTATYFSIADLREKRAPLKSVTVARVDAAASRKASKELQRTVRVLRVYGCTDVAAVDCTTKRLPLEGSLTTVALDAASGETLAWRGNTVASGGKTETNVPFTGLLIKFPFDAQKRTYRFWNGDQKKSLPVRYIGETKLRGLTVYRYQQTIAPTVVGRLDLPGSLIGRKEPTVSTDQVASSTTTYLVEPRTGVIMSATSAQHSYAAVRGHRVLTVTDGTFVSSDDTIAESVDHYRTLARALTALRFQGPAAGLAAGALSLVTAAVLLARRRAGRPAATARPTAAPSEQHAAGG